MPAMADGRHGGGICELTHLEAADLVRWSLTSDALSEICMHYCIGQARTTSATRMPFEHLHAWKHRLSQPAAALPRLRARDV